MVEVGDVWERLNPGRDSIKIGDLIIITDLSKTYVKYRFVSREHNKHLNYTRMRENFVDNFKEVIYDTH
jgi:hypothetical protein